MLKDDMGCKDRRLNDANILVRDQKMSFDQLI